MPLSSDPEKRARQLANLRPVPENLRPAPPAPEGHQRSLVHGGYSELLLRDIETEVRELMDALAEGAPSRAADGTVPVADWAAIETAARALKRYRTISAWCDLHGRLVERGKSKGAVKGAAAHELSCERALARALDALGMTPTSRARLGVDVARGRALLGAGGPDMRDWDDERLAEYRRLKAREAELLASDGAAA